MKIDDRTKRYPLIKNNFYPGKLLHASDFIREQEYGNDKLEFLNRKFHGYGIIDGLQVVAGSEEEILLRAGSAIDGRGRLIIMPETIKLNAKEIAGISGGEFVLGIQYAEKAVGRERSFLEKEEVYQAAGIEETFSLRAYTAQDWQALHRYRTMAALTEEKILYEDGRIRLSVCTPRIVPSDSVFRLSLQICSLTGERTEVKWRGICKLQGAGFLLSGRSLEVLEGEEIIVSGTYGRDWQLCTEEARRLPIIIELEQLEISSEHSGSARLENVQLCVEPTADYSEAIQKYLCDMEESGIREDGAAAGRRTEEWVPLALLRQDGNAGEGQPSLHILKDKEVRQLAVRPDRERLFRRLQEESGIVDIRWRGLLKRMYPTPEPVPPGQHRFPEPVQPGQHHLPEPVQLPLPESVPSPETPLALCFRQGIAIISVPRRYRRGQVLLSEEISHGLSGKGVLIYCGRMYEERNYEFWEKSRNKHFIISGQEALFEEKGQGGWYIEGQAVRQNIEAGSFRIAVTLRKGQRRKRDREVAVSWLAVTSG